MKDGADYVAAVVRVQIGETQVGQANSNGQVPATFSVDAPAGTTLVVLAEANGKGGNKTLVL